MSLLETNTVEIKRMGVEINVRGKLERSEDTSFEIKASVQPETNMKYVRESFGGHVEAAIKIFTKENLLLRKDQVKWDGNTYEVSEIRSYKCGRLEHFKTLAIMVKDDTRKT